MAYIPVHLRGHKWEHKYKTVSSYLSKLQKREKMFLWEIRNIDPSIKDLSDKQVLSFLKRLLVLTLQKIKKANNCGIAVKITNPKSFFWTWVNPFRLRFSKRRYDLYVFRAYSNKQRKLKTHS